MFASEISSTSKLVNKLPPYRCDTLIFAAANKSPKEFSISYASYWNGAIYRILPAGFPMIVFKIAISAILVLPLLVGILTITPD